MARPGSDELATVKAKLGPAMELRRPYIGVGGDNLPKKQDLLTGPHQWRVYCGEGRFNWNDKNGLLLRGGIALNFQIMGGSDGVATFEAGIFWEDGWSLMLHSEADHKEWPIHAKTHFQLNCDHDASPRPPFADWRLPVTADVFQWIEYLVAMIIRAN